MSISAAQYQPPFGLRSAHIQSMLGSGSLRRMLVLARSKELLAAEQEWLLDCGKGIRLIGHYSSRPVNRAGLAVLIHGWEGSSRSNYILSTGAKLFDQGFNVFRLNLRDHGDSHHLNPGVFHSCRLQEVIGALGDMQNRMTASNWVIAGFSLGGNFALRVALHGAESGLSIDRCVSICPVLNPEHVLKSMEDGPTFYEDYYNRKWAKSLRKKQACFPDRYDYKEWHRLPDMRERTRYLATRYYGYQTLEEYFEGYSIAGDRLAGLTVPSSILTSMDDPVVPVGDTNSLPDEPNIEIDVTEHGGHCGYLKNWKLESWAEDYILDRFVNRQIA
ncbi:MAG: putative alpha/beta-fold hydrolase [Lysobacterales bacterium]|jgi:predicted alpha/beta-fold hydrolase